MDGQPSSLDTYWQAYRSVLRNGAAYGTYQTLPQAWLGILKFVLVIPEDVIDLEVWHVAL